MGKCVLKRYEQGELISYSCDQVRSLHEEWKFYFRKFNRVDEILKSGRKDEMYERFCKSIDAFLAQCNCSQKDNKGQEVIKSSDYYKCTKCQDSDHEINFCRCEQRNIRIAKEKRDNGECPWTSLQPERSKREDSSNDEMRCSEHASNGMREVQ